MSQLFWQLVEAWWQLQLFLERGGPILYWIMTLLALLWLLIIERWLFFTRTYPALEARVLQQWENRPERQSWVAHQIRSSLLADCKIRTNTALPLIKTLIALCPLLGLLGTVTGMIEVFDVMALLGGGSPKAMAAGISKATLPTMAGMVAALSGIFAQSYLQKMADRRYRALEEKLTFDH